MCTGRFSLFDFTNCATLKTWGAQEVEAFVSFLANDRKVSATHRQALLAFLYLCKEALDIQLPWVQEIGRPKPRFRIPIVLSRDEVSQLLGVVDEKHRLMECLQLPVKDIDFDRKVSIVRQTKGGKDRVVMLPASFD